MRVTGKAKPCVWRWQQRFMETGADALLADKTPPSRIPPLGNAVTQRVVALTLTEPPGEVRHWTAVAIAKACVVSVSSVHRIWRSQGLRPHQIRQFKLSNDPRFATLDVLGGSVIGRCMQRHTHQEFIRFLNAVEGFFAKFTSRRLKRGVLHFIVALQSAINCFVKEVNQNPKPFRWTKNPDEIIADVRRGHQALDSHH